MTYLIYTIGLGFIATAILGLATCWLDRKITARLQYRVGPRFLQPFVDIAKLLFKETLIPQGASKITFLLAPVIGFAAVILASSIIWLNNIQPQKAFGGDLIVALYLLAIPSISIIIGGFASKNPYASLGASREMKLVLAYELPLVLAVMVPIIKTNFSLRIGEIVMYQASNPSIIMSVSGALAFIAVMMSVQAKLGLVPFDIAEAETEIIGGPLIEYSGAPLAVYRLMKNMLMFVLPFFVVTLFMSGLKINGINILYSILKYIGVVTVIVVVRNTNPRVRIDQALRFFWGPMTIMAALAVMLALFRL